MEDSYTNKVLQAISTALNEGVNDVTKVVLTISAVILLAVVTAVVFRFKNRKRIIKSSENSYQKLIRRFNLTILELDLIDKLAGTLRKPEEKYILLVNASRFRQAEHRAGLFDDAEKELAAVLKIKLGFTDSDSEDGEISSKSLVRGMPAKISGGEDASDAEVYSVSETNLTVKLSGEIPVIPGETLILYTPAEGAMRLFSLKADKVRGELFSAPHRNAEKEVKQRIRIRIFLELQNSENNISRKSMIVMLTGRGAVITDRKNELREGDTVRIFLDNDKKKKYPVEAGVEKISEEKGLASVKFTNN